MNGSSPCRHAASGIRRCRLGLALAGLAVWVSGEAVAVEPPLVEEAPVVPRREPPVIRPRVIDLTPNGPAVADPFAAPADRPAPDERPPSRPAQPIIRPRVIDLRPEAIPPAEPPVRTPVAEPAPEPLPPQVRQLAAETEELLDQQAGLSHDAFRRGLMDLTDYTEHLQTVLRGRLLLAELAEDPEQLAAVLARHAERLEGVVELVKMLNEPGAVGHLAELAQTQTLLADAERELALLTEDAERLAEANARRTSFAERLFRHRVEDYRLLGTATVPQMMQAAALLFADPGYDLAAAGAGQAPVEPGLATYRDLLDRVASESEELWRRGAGLAAHDQALEARQASAHADAWLAAAAEPPRATPAWRDAEEAAGELFDLRLRLIRTGTVRLFDLGRAWRQRQTLHESAVAAGLELPAEWHTRRHDDLHALLDLTTGVTDLRGRNAADVLFVQALERIEQLKAVLAERDAARAPTYEEPDAPAAETPRDVPVPRGQPVPISPRVEDLSPEPPAGPDVQPPRP